MLTSSPLQPTLHIWVHSWCYLCYRFGQITQISQHHTERLPGLHTLLLLPSHFCFSSSDLYSVYTISIVPECFVIGIIQSTALTDSLLVVTRIEVSCPNVFCCVIMRFLCSSCKNSVILTYPSLQTHSPVW